MLLPMDTPKKSLKNDQKDQDSVSITGWMVIQFLLFIPVVNGIVSILLALFGRNPTQRNFFRAQIVWGILFVLGGLLLFALGLLPKDIWASAFKYMQTQFSNLWQWVMSLKFF